MSEKLLTLSETINEKLIVLRYNKIFTPCSCYILDGWLIILPRLYVYHNDKEYLSDIDTTFLLMEHRLLKYIMKPALVATYAFGFILIYENHYLLSENYFLLKLVLVFILSLFHIYLSILYKDFKKGYR